MLHLCLFTVLLSVGQNNVPKIYYSLVKSADSLYNLQEYKKSAFTYSEAFKEAGWKGTSTDRYNAACSWALANHPDSAFYNLFKIANFLNYMDYDHMVTDSDLSVLHEDKRWALLINKVKENKDKAEEHLNKPLVRILDTIYTEDQKYRMEIDEVGKKYGSNSEQMKTLWETINEKDRVNLKKVTAILDKYGWLGAEEIGEQGSITLFLVIQHSDQKIQENYLPMMREAVKNKKALPANLALLEDRVSIGRGKKQIYGSQVSGVLGQYYLLPLQNPDSVDKRRSEVGLQPLAEYLSRWQIKWDVEECKRQQVQLETTEKCGISFVNMDISGLVTWIAKEDTTKLPYIIEQYRWKKWIKMAEVEDSGKDEFNKYSCYVIPYHGENYVRIKHGNPICVSDSVKLNADTPEIKFQINKKKKEIEFNFDTFYEITDKKGVLFKKGYAKTIPIDNLPKDNYILYYDNSTVEFKK